MERRHFIGIDGGGTKTDAVLMDCDGGILARAGAGSSSIIGKPSPESMEVVKSLFDLLCSRAGVSCSLVGYCVLGLNGVDFEDEYEMQRDDFLHCLDLEPERFALVNDGIPALWGATSSPRAAILQHGTGITSAYRGAYGNEKLFDHLNVCHCFDMRAEVLKLVARMNAGAAEETPLLKQVLAHLSLSPERFPEYYYRSMHSCTIDAKPLMEIVFRLWQKGDPGAGILVDKAADDYALLLMAMLKKAGGAGSVAVIGGGVVNSAPERLRSEVARRIGAACPGVRTQAPELSPAIGAAIMAAFRYGIDPAGVYRKIKESADEKN